MGPLNMEILPVEVAQAILLRTREQIRDMPVLQFQDETVEVTTGRQIVDAPVLQNQEKRGRHWTVEQQECVLEHIAKQIVGASVPEEIVDLVHFTPPRVWEAGCGRDRSPASGRNF